MAKTKSKNTAKGGGVTAKKTSASTTAKRKATAAPSKTAKKRSRRVQEESGDDEEDQEEIETAEEVEERDDDGVMEEGSQEVPEEMESNFLETQQRDEMAELKARLQAKRLQKLKKTMNSRVSQFDDMFAESMGEIKKAEGSSAAKELQRKTELLKSFVESCVHEDDDSGDDLEQVFKSLKGVTKAAGSACSKFADRDLAGTDEILAATRQNLASRPKRIAHSAREMASHLAKELDEMGEKTKNQLDAGKWAKDHFKALAKFGARA